MTHYLILEVLVPIFFGLITIIIGSNRFSEFLLLGSNIIGIGLLTKIYPELIDKGEILYQLGGYENSYGIELKLNFFSFIILAIANFSFLPFSLYKLACKKFTYIQNALVLLCIAGFNGIFMSNDMFNIYVFLELYSITSCALLGSFHNLRIAKSSFDYLIFGTVGAAFYLIGIAFLYMLSGTLNISQLLRFIAIYTPYTSGFLWLSLFFIALGLIIKLGVFPIHRWLFKIYYRAPSPMRMFLSITSAITSIYLLIIFLLNIYNINNIVEHLKILPLLQIIGISSAIIFSFSAFTSKTSKELLIYSSFADIGYLLNSIGLIYGYQNNIGGQMIIFQIINTLLSKPALFMLTAKSTLQNINSKYKIILHFGITIFFILNLIGIPPFLGFFGKFFTFTYIIQQKNWINLIGTVIANLFSCLYGVKLINIITNEKKLVETNLIEKNNKTSQYHIAIVFVSSFLILFAILSVLIFSDQAKTVIDLATYNLLVRR